MDIVRAVVALLSLSGRLARAVALSGRPSGNQVAAAVSARRAGPWCGGLLSGATGSVHGRAGSSALPGQFTAGTAPVLMGVTGELRRAERAAPLGVPLPPGGAGALTCRLAGVIGTSPAPDASVDGRLVALGGRHP